jgi:hypothetical protein
MLSTFYRRSCLGFQSSATVTCQSSLDLGLIFLAAIGAGIAFSDEKFGILGFLPAHVIATTLFVTVLMIPSSIGALDPSLSNTILEQLIIVAFNSQFPIALFLSLIGGPIGTFIGEKIPRGSTIEQEFESYR